MQFDNEYHNFFVILFVIQDLCLTESEFYLILKTKYFRICACKVCERDRFA